TGPNYETRSEYRMVRKIGGDVVGMSTVPEVLVAHALGMRVLALSAVTNVAKPDALVETTAEGVIDIAQLAEPKLNAIVMTIVDNINRK
ncbi:MAG: purine-nucleoside phosphorylase, partial [Pirellulaceae bacterium]